MKWILPIVSTEIMRKYHLGIVELLLDLRENVRMYIIIVIIMNVI